MSNPFKDPPPSPGIKAITRQDIRWQRCDVKTIALIANVLLRQQAVDIGAYETILLRDGYVMEGAATNVFVVYQGEVLTPPKSQFILPGITRDLVLEILRVNQFPCHEVDIPIAQLFSAEEIWITGSISGILPVITLDDKPVGIGQRGPVWTKIWGWYQSYKQMLRQN